MRDLMNKEDYENLKQFEQVVEEIAMLAPENLDKVIQTLNEIKPEEGKIN